MIAIVRVLVSDMIEDYTYEGPWVDIDANGHDGSMYISIYQEDGDPTGRWAIWEKGAWTSVEVTKPAPRAVREQIKAQKLAAKERAVQESPFAGLLQRLNRATEAQAPEQADN